MTHDQHTDVEGLLGAYALDAVDPEETERIEAHLADCPRCRAEVDRHREVAAAIGNSVEPLPATCGTASPDSWSGRRCPTPSPV